MLNTYNHIRFRILVQCKGSEINITPFLQKTNLPALPIEYINEKIATIKNCRRSVCCIGSTDRSLEFMVLFYPGRFCQLSGDKPRTDIKGES